MVQAIAFIYFLAKLLKNLCKNKKSPPLQKNLTMAGIFCIMIMYLLDNNGVINVIVFFSAANCILSVIGIDYGAFEILSEIGVDGMYDIAIASIGIFSRRHNDKVSFSCVDNFDIMDCKAIVEGYGNDRFHRAFIEKLSDFDVSNLHMCSFLILHVFCELNILYNKYIINIQKCKDF